MTEDQWRQMFTFIRIWALYDLDMFEPNFKFEYRCSMMYLYSLIFFKHLGIIFEKKGSLHFLRYGKKRRSVERNGIGQYDATQLIN